MNLFDEFFLIVAMFNRRGVAYAVVGGVALAFYDRPRYTKDIDFLVPPDGADGADAALIECGYFESAQPWTFSNTNVTLRRYMKCSGTEYLVIDVLVGNEPRHREIVERAVLVDSGRGAVRLAGKDDLIWMKRQRNSDIDQADIRNLSGEPRPHDED